MHVCVTVELYIFCLRPLVCKGIVNISVSCHSLEHLLRFEGTDNICLSCLLLILIVWDLCTLLGFAFNFIVKLVFEALGHTDLHSDINKRTDTKTRNCFESRS